LSKVIPAPYGCVDWSPNPIEEEVDDERKASLKQEYVDAKPNWDKVDELMALSYAAQRSLINTNSPVEVVLDEWPFLSKPKYILHHYYRLMAKDESNLPEDISARSCRVYK